MQGHVWQGFFIVSIQGKTEPFAFQIFIQIIVYWGSMEDKTGAAI
jgi:hypothetical protein